MKRISFILMAWALVMTLSQCKKEQQTLPNDTDESVAITLDVKSGNGPRVEVTPNTGTVDFEIGDKIYVACAGKYVGTLTHDGTRFSGNISNAVTDSLLRFYFLGNVSIPDNELVAGSTESCTIDISNQSETYSNGKWHLPVISYGSSTEPYGAQTSYSAYLRNRCALVKFKVHQGVVSNQDIFVSGLNHLVTIGFNGDSFTYDKFNEGYINIGKGSYDQWVDKWVILLPQEALPGAEGGTYINNDYNGYRSAIPTISPNAYLTSGIQLWVDDVSGLPVPTGAIGGLFSVNNSQQVWFSQGNLRNIGDENNPIWEFAENQEDYEGSIDLFAWDKATATYNNITNGNPGATWRNLSYAGWSYIMHYRNTDSGVLLLFPDNWKSSVYMIHNYDSPGVPFNSNVIDADGEAVLRANGVVFLPAIGSSGKYWTSTATDITNRSYSVDITNTNLSYGYTGIQTKISIRLVQDYIPAK